MVEVRATARGRHGAYRGRVTSQRKGRRHRREHGRAEVEVQRQAASYSLLEQRWLYKLLHSSHGKGRRAGRR